MTDKWRWILLVWHGWRCAVWHAEAAIRLGPRLKYAERMRDWHMHQGEQMHRALFPPPPIDFDDLMRDFRGKGTLK
jgi:hypothetical protein